jgi:acyl-CoA reductase-like NAD-dependent aldehyde dehydrogenase
VRCAVLPKHDRQRVNEWLLRDLRTPFGGMKQSGVGREGGDEALRFFTEPKTVCVKYPADAPV